MITARAADGEKVDGGMPAKSSLEVLFEWEPGGGPLDRVAIRRRDVIFGFNAHAVVPRTRPDGTVEWQIEAEWTSDPRLRGKYVFLRTRSTIVRTEWKSIDAAMANLGPLPIFRTHHGTFVNLDAVGPLNFGEKQKRLGFRAGDPRSPRVEWILLSRRRGQKL